MTDIGTLVLAGQVIPEGSLSEAAIARLLEYGLVSQITDDEAAAITPPVECEECS